MKAAFMQNLSIVENHTLGIPRTLGLGHALVGFCRLLDIEVE